MPKGRSIITILMLCRFDNSKISYISMLADLILKETSQTMHVRNVMFLTIN